MRVFVTGATGFVGSAVVDDLLGAGYQVLGLARSEESAAKLAAKGAEILRGDLEERDSLRRGAAAADGVIHTAFLHDFSRFAECCEIDRLAIESLGDALEGSGKPLIVTSGVALLAPGRLATEDDQIPDIPGGFPRKSEPAGDAQLARGVKSMTVRLSPSVHGDGDRIGFIPIFIKTAREKGVSAYVGDGQNRWAGVHRLDAAPLYRLALEKGAAGKRYHGVADKGIPIRQIAEIIGRKLNLPVVSIAPEEATAHFGWFSMFAGMDLAASSEKTQQALGWTPTHKGLIADLEEGTYFGG